MKKINYKVIIVLIGLILFESFFYFLAKLTPFEPYLLTSVVDSKLPLISHFIYFYIFWYLLLFIIPYIIYQKNNRLFYEYLSVFAVCVIFSTIVFFFFPTTIERGDILVNSISTFLLNLIYLTDTPALNCLPSMHCAVCFIFIYYSFKLNLKWYYKLLLIIVSILIILSTLFIKQHVIWDALAALGLVIIVVCLIKKLKLTLVLEKGLEKYLK